MGTLKYPNKNFVYSRLYHIYNGIKQRCYYPKAASYKWYGAKGIVMCDEWKNDFMSFYNWAITNGYFDRLTIDRIDSNGNYEPSNCKWVTYKQQANNRSSNAFLSLNGVTHTIAEWSDITGIPKGTIQHRKHKNWSDEKALTTPVKYYKKQFTENEIEQMKIDRKNGMSYRELGLKYNTDRCIISKFVRGLRN